MAEPSEVVAILAGGGGTATILYGLVQWLVKREAERDRTALASAESTAEENQTKVDAARARVEAERDASIKTTLEIVRKIELDLAQQMVAHAQDRGTLAKVEARVEGISNDHAPKILALQKAETEIRTRLDRAERDIRERASLPGKSRSS